MHYLTAFPKLFGHILLLNADVTLAIRGERNETREPQDNVKLERKSLRS